MTAVAPYSAFARVYDSVSGRRGLDLYAPVYERIMGQQQVQGGRALDVACGTGLWCRRLAERGWSVVGIDLSAEMLREARRRCSGLDAAFLEGDMRSLPLEEGFDLVTCTYDSLNYVANESELSSVLGELHRALRPGGLAIFDTNTSFALRKLWGTQEIVQRSGRTRCIWATRWDSKKRTNTLTMEIFEPRRGLEVYDRAVEVHVERALDPEPVRRACLDAGFVDVKSLDAEDLAPAGRTTGKAVFVSRKKLSRSS